MSINKVILIGNVGREPQVRYFDTGNAVASFTLATTERGYTMQNGTKVPAFMWKANCAIAHTMTRTASTVPSARFMPIHWSCCRVLQPAIVRRQCPSMRTLRPMT